jgi:acyl dehydratase
MPIDVASAMGSALPAQDVGWTPADVVRYHLVIGAVPSESRFADERRVRVLPTFATTVPATFGIAAAAAFDDDAPRKVRAPGIEVDLDALLHYEQDVTLSRPLPAHAVGCARTRVVDVYDRRGGAVIVQDTTLTDGDGATLFAARTSLYARGERTGAAPPAPSLHAEPPERPPDAELDSPTLPQQARLYQLCGERNPIHVDRECARAAGLPGPILQGTCTLGIVCKVVVDALLESDARRVQRVRARFTGIAFPGETLRTRVWRSGGELIVAAAALERGGAPVLAGVLTTSSPA